MFSAGCSIINNNESISENTENIRKKCEKDEDCIAIECCDFCGEATNRKYEHWYNTNCTPSECDCNIGFKAICENNKCIAIEHNQPSKDNKFPVLKSENLSECKEIKNNIEKDECYMRNIRDSKDYSLCDNITDNAKKDQCYNGMALKNQNSNLCHYIDGSDLKDWCYSIVALETKNSSLCDKVINEQRKMKCFNNVK